MAELKKFAIGAIKTVAPGTQLREALEQILKAKTGALIVIGDLEKIRPLMNGGFPLDIDFSPNKLYELSKMDGAIILSKDCKKILFANVILLPDSNIPSQETGARHATAERVARQTGQLVISVSQRKDTITLYQNDWKYILRDVEEILAKATQALQTLERYRSVYDEFLQRLNALEIENQVTLLEVLLFLHRMGMLLAIGKEVENYLIELGSEGRLIELQLETLLAGVSEEGLLTVRDYSRINEDYENVYKNLLNNFKGDFQSFSIIAGEIMGYTKKEIELNITVVPRGYRLLSRLSFIPNNIMENLVKHFGVLPRILESSVEDLDNIEGIGEVRAKRIKEGLIRLRKSALII
ncbi:MAG: DNA integrity scanning diadenylate cyclase DisA [Dictyoglomus sp.]|nr:DNA integrity scanning diadenylate cyclase DisA [Dictyoglomus sp.]MCX7942515.1 DNA integrity scanning diadenylate cyclase DisA [Dictyoglomaceae bacterium]MDW8188753.1 DNA integrity scanning diadenylate cyclase DisA [Dictyoglomus sp.]